MRRIGFLAMMLTGALACAFSASGHERGRYHHHLRGRIVKVEPTKSEFTIRTNQGEVALCFIDAETVLKRDGRRIELNEVHAGERAYCHCAAMKDGKHYSEQLLLEKKKNSE